MTPRYPAAVTVNGQTLADSWDGFGQAVLDDLTITWGRDDIYDEPEPSKATITVLDPTGSWATDYELYNAPLTIDRPGSKVFRGTVDSIRISPTTVLNPATNAVADIWKVTVTAIDPTALLAKYVPLGYGSIRTLPLPVALETEEWGPDFFTYGTITQRLNDVIIRLREQNVFQTIQRDGPAESQFQVPARTMGEQVSALDHIRECFRYVPLAHTNYNADNDSLEIGRTAIAPGIALRNIANTLRIVPTAGASVSAGTVGLTSDLSVDVSPSHAISAVDIECFRTVEVRRDDGASPPNSYSVPTVEDALVGANVTPAPPHGGANRLAIRFAGNAAKSAVAMQKLANDSASKAARLNGKHYTPPIVFDLERHDYAPELVEILLRIRDVPTPVTILGSRYSALQRFGPAFQIIGGTLRYTGKHGWLLAATAAPVESPDVTPLALGQLVTNPTPTMGQFDAALTLADIGLVTIGLS